jgi:hypothetical protein
MVWSFVYLAVRQVSALIVLGGRSDRSKELEILVLRHELAVLRRRSGRPGFEPADRALLAFERLPTPPGLDLWLVDNLNPDENAAGMRQNAHAVDLNRNFPWAWRRRNGIYDSGPRPLSEPESRIAYHLILRVRPPISIWFHQAPAAGARQCCRLGKPPRPGYDRVRCRVTRRFTLGRWLYPLRPRCTRGSERTKASEVKVEVRTAALAAAISHPPTAPT